MYLPAAETLMNIAIVSLVLCGLIMGFGWLFDKLGVKNVEKVAGVLLLWAIVLGAGSAIAGAILSLGK